MCKIICPVCEKQGKKSKVFSNGCSSTLMAFGNYHDKDGNYHYHDFNITTEYYECEFGHTFIRKGHGGCPSYPEYCDFKPEWEILSTTNKEDE